MTPTLSVDVNLCNPGQVFACCGLFELAHRLTPSEQPAMGWFEDARATRTQFHVRAHTPDNLPVTLDSLLEEVKQCSPEGDESKKEGPVRLGVPFNFLIDWRKAYPQNKLVKTWAGQQSIAKIVAALVAALPSEPDSSILGVATATDRSVTAYDISKCENAQDAGFSLDKLKGYETHAAVATEFLALVALQRFCPVRDDTRLGRRFHVWMVPLPVAVAASAINTELHGIPQRSLVYSMYERDSEGRYKAFGISKFAKEN